MLLVLTPLLFGLSFLSGMLGLGVAFIAIPVLGLFGFDLKDVIQPWALLLNGLTAISGAIAFWRAGMVDRRGALAPRGHHDDRRARSASGCCSSPPPTLVWWLYVGVLLFLAVRMLLPKPRSTENVAEITDAAGREAGVAAVPISIFAGFLGVGPGFLLMPTLTLVGYSARLAAATNSVAVTVPSFSAFASHLGTATFDWPTVIITSVASVIGAWLGARFTAGRVKSATLSRIFAIALVAARRAARLDPPARMTISRTINRGDPEELPHARWSCDRPAGAAGWTSARPTSGRRRHRGADRRPARGPASWRCCATGRTACARWRPPSASARTTSATTWRGCARRASSG